MYRYFSSFPVQVAVLFSPTDTNFTTAFREIFLSLDRITGERLAFFAVLDPPKDWQDEARTRTWWQQQEERFGSLGFSFDQRPLVSEIARRFGIEWWEMPAIVVSPNLWAAEYVVAPTSASLLEAQLTRLTYLAQAWGRPDINHIIGLLEDELGTEVRHFSANFTQRDSLYQFYDVLDNYDPRQNRISHKGRFNQQVSQALSMIRGQSNPLQFSRSPYAEDRWSQTRQAKEDNLLFDQAATEAAGRLVPVASVAERVFSRLNKPENLELVTALDETSVAMIETSLTVGNFLEAVQRNDVPGVKALRFADRQRDANPVQTLDYSAGAVGIWKALELETNMSLIQAGRCVLGITMPDYFLQHVPDFPGDAIVITGHYANGDPMRVDLNLLDRSHPPRHALLTLGRGWHLVKEMLNDETRALHNLIVDLLGNPLPNIVLETWQAIRPIRNKASHVSAITEKDYKNVVNMGLNIKFLTPMMTLKTRLRTGP
jgi:hypothetical protein